MAILLIYVEDTSSLPLNEFFDYNGHCYGLSRSRYEATENAIELEDFYEASIDTEALTDIPVVFVSDDDSQWAVAGWYQKATVFAKVKHPTLFLEGNVIADSSAAVCLTQPKAIPLEWDRNQEYYMVLEEEDSRYQMLQMLITTKRTDDGMLRYPFLHITLDPKYGKTFEGCIQMCEMLAEAVMADQCQDIRELKSLEQYAKRAVSLNSKDADGYYYQAMACYQLGFLKDGMKAIEKALKLEPEASDLIAQKAYLLSSMGYWSESAKWFHRAFAESGEEDYLVLEGRVLLGAGQIDRAYEILSQVENKLLLEEAGIELKDMERRWPFISIRRGHLKEIFSKRK